MSKKLSKSLIINIELSWYTIGWLLAIHIGAGVTVTLLDLQAGLQSALWVALSLSCVVTLRTHGWRGSARAVTALQIERSGLCALRYGRDERWHEGTLRSCTVYPWLAVLSVRPANRRRRKNFIIPADAVAPDVFRRSRLELKAWSSAV